MILEPIAVSNENHGPPKRFNSLHKTEPLRSHERAAGFQWIPEAASF